MSQPIRAGADCWCRSRRTATRGSSRRARCRPPRRVRRSTGAGVRPCAALRRRSVSGSARKRLPGLAEPRRRPARLLRPPTQGLEGLSGRRDHDRSVHVGVRRDARLDAGSSRRPIRRPHRHRLPPRIRRRLRPIAEFSEAYADLTERDHALARAGRERRSHRGATRTLSGLYRRDAADFHPTRTMRATPWQADDSHVQNSWPRSSRPIRRAREVTRNATRCEGGDIPCRP